MKRILTLHLIASALVMLTMRTGYSADENKLWWERGADKWYYKDDWKGLALTGGRSYRHVIDIPDKARSGWIVIWGDRFYRLRVNGTVVEEDHTSGIIEHHDLTRFVHGADEVEILVEADGRIVAEGEILTENRKSIPFATGSDWEIPSSSRKPTARPMISEPSTGAFHRSHNGLLMTHNDEETGKTLIAKGFARVQKLDEQSLFLLRRFCPAEEMLDLSNETLRHQTEQTIRPLIANAGRILQEEAVPAQKASHFQEAIAAARKAGDLLASAEATIAGTIQIYQTERDVLHLENCLAILSGEKLLLPDRTQDLEELRRIVSDTRREQRLFDCGSTFKALGTAREQIERLKEEISGIWGRPVGKLDEFPDDRFGWLNARELMGHDPAAWEFNISPDRLACLNLVGLWEFSTDPDNEGEKKSWHRGEATERENHWQRIYAPRPWEWQGIQKVNENSPADCPYRLGDRRTGDKPYNGFAWYRKRVFVPASWSGQSLILKIGEVKNWLQIFVNGKKVSENGVLNPPAGQEYRIPGELLRFGQENLIAIQVYNHDNLGGITAGPLCLALEGHVPEIVETPGPLRYVDEIRWPGENAKRRYVLLSSALSPAVVLSTNEASLSLWGWRLKGYSNPAGFRVVAEGKSEFFQTDEGHPITCDGTRLTDNWILLESADEVTRSVLIVLQKTPVSISWDRNALRQWGIRLGFKDCVGRAIIACFPGGQEVGEEDCRFWSRALLACPTSVSELCKPDGDQLTADFWLRYNYMILPSFGEGEPRFVSPLPMLFSYGMKDEYPGLSAPTATATSYSSEYAPYRVCEGRLLHVQAPLVDRSRVIKGIGELFGKMQAPSNTRCGVTEDQMFRDMGQWGFDHCRYAFAFHANWDIPLCRWMGGPLLDNEKAWKRLDELVTKCNDNGMMMMLTWFFNEDSPQRDTDNRVRNSSAYWRKRPETRQNAYELWRRIAARYKDLPADAISYDFFNEPAYMEPEDWNRIIRELTEIVRSVDRKHMIVIEGGDGWAQPFWCWWMEPTGDANTIYSFHHYGKHWGYAYDEYYPSYKRTFEQSQVDPWLQAILFGIRHRVPIHCGEFGVSQISPDEDYARWLNDYLAFFERFGVGWNWWNYSGSDIYRTGLVCGRKISPNVAILRKWIAKAMER